MRSQRNTNILFLAAFAAFFFFAFESVLIASLLYSSTFFQAHLIIATSLIGMLLGGWLASHFPQDRNLQYCLLALPLCVYVGIFSVLIAFAHAYVAAVILTLVFVPVGYILSILYTRARSWSLYAVELFGAVGGLLFIVFSLPILREENLLLLLASISLFGLIIGLWRNTSPARLAVLVAFTFLSVVLFVSNLRTHELHFATDVWCDVEKAQAMHLNKIFCSDERNRPYTVIRSLGSHTDRIEVVDTTEGDYKGVIFSGNRNDIIQPFAADRYIHDARIPSGIVESPSVLIIGAGAEGVAKVAKSAGARDITVIEINPAIIALWEDDEELNEFSHQPFLDTELTFGDGRSYIARSNQQYDIITMMNTHRSTNIQLFGRPDFLHTTKSYADMLSRLTPEGFLSIEEVSVEGAGDVQIANSIYTLKTTLKNLGAEEPRDHIVAYQWVGIRKGEEFGDEYRAVYTQFLVKRTPWTEAELASFKQWADASHDTFNFVKPTNMAVYQLLWQPGDEVLDPTGSEIIVQALKENQPIFSGQRELTDDRPFMTEINKYDLRLLGFLGLVLALAGALIIGTGRQQLRDTYGYLSLLYFVLIGLGFMFLEIFLLFWLQLYIDSVILSFATVVGGLFTASAVSAVWFWPHRQGSVIQLLGAVLAGVIVLMVIKHGLSFELAYSTRIGVGFLSSAALGFCLAPFFPLGIERFSKGDSQAIPLLVGANMAALAVGVPLGILIAVYGGLSILIMAGVGMYLGAVLISQRFT